VVTLLNMYRKDQRRGLAALGARKLPVGACIAGDVRVEKLGMGIGRTLVLSGTAT
jgi:hypothetical protein